MLVACSSILFFQAEDGIRDGHVTGVQTCALPIFRERSARRSRTRRRLGRRVRLRRADRSRMGPVPAHAGPVSRDRKSVVEGKRGKLGRGGRGEGQRQSTEHKGWTQTQDRQNREEE